MICQKAIGGIHGLYMVPSNPTVYGAFLKYNAIYVTTPGEDPPVCINKGKTQQLTNYSHKCAFLHIPLFTIIPKDGLWVS
jgi:hypothetical protein